MFAPSPETSLSAADPRKNQQYDDTVYAGLGPAPVAPSLLEALYHQAGPTGLIFVPLNLAKYEATLAKGVVAVGLEDLHVTPHTARHTGASRLLLKKWLSLSSVTTRGGWTCDSSVRRYAKAGRLHKQLHRLSLKQMTRAGTLLRSGESAIMLLKHVRMLDRLRARTL